jgi:CRP/FNR family transcriptional regulator, cyclic AMP receptor protein
MQSVDFIKQFPTQTYKKGETLLTEGQTASNLLAIRSGFIKVTSLDENGNERMLWIAGRYDIVPTEHLFSNHSPLNFFYTALSPVEIYKIPKDEFLTHAKSNLPLMTDIAASMSAHYDDLLVRINSIGQPNIHEKLVATLRYLAERFSANTIVDLYELGLPVTHQDLAEMIGSTRETTSIELKKLQTGGYIQYDRSHFIIYLEKFLS